MVRRQQLEASALAARQQPGELDAKAPVQFAFPEVFDQARGCFPEIVRSLS